MDFQKPNERLKDNALKNVPVCIKTKHFCNVLKTQILVCRECLPECSESSIEIGTFLKSQLQWFYQNDLQYFAFLSTVKVLSFYSFEDDFCNFLMKYKWTFQLALISSIAVLGDLILH